MTGMQTVAFRAYDQTRSVDVNFPPQFTVAQIALSEVGGAGLHYNCSRSFRHRPQPAGAEQEVRFDRHFYNQPSVVAKNNRGQTPIAA